MGPNYAIERGRDRLLGRANIRRIWYSRSRMARRPDPSEFDKPLTRDDLAELVRRLSLLSPYDVQQAYRRAHQQCCMQGELLPRAASIQEMVAAWKIMRRWKRRKPPSRD